MDNGRVDEARYTLLGTDASDFFVPMYMGMLAIGLIAAFRPKWRIGGAAAAIGGFAGLLLNPLAPTNIYFVWLPMCLGISLDAWIRGRAEGRRKRLVGVLAGALPLAMMAWATEPGRLRQEIVLSSDRIVMRQASTEASGERHRLAVRENERGWKIRSAFPAPGSDPLAVLDSRERYRDAYGQILNGDEVAHRIVDWAGIKLAPRSLNE